MLPSGFDAQFALFQKTCEEIKRLADGVGHALLQDQERGDHEVSVPKALDNAIINYVRTVDKRLRRDSGNPAP